MEIVAQSAPGIVELPLLGVVAAGVPIEPVEVNDILGVPRELVRSPDTFALRVKGDSMIDEQIRDGDLILVQSTPTAREGETVVALVRGEATVKRFYRVDGKVVLRPANERLEPIVAGGRGRGDPWPWWSRSFASIDGEAWVQAPPGACTGR